MPQPLPRREAPVDAGVDPASLPLTLLYLAAPISMALLVLTLLLWAQEGSHELQGISVEEIVARVPQVTHADVYASLAYFSDHREAMLAEGGAGRSVGC